MSNAVDAAASHEEDAENTIKLLSNDGMSFVISLDVAEVSKTISRMLENDDFIETQTKEMNLDFPGEIVQIVVDYMHYKHEHGYKTNLELMGVQPFRIDPEKCLDVLPLADYLKC